MHGGCGPRSCIGGNYFLNTTSGNPKSVVLRQLQPRNQPQPTPSSKGDRDCPLPFRIVLAWRTCAPLVVLARQPFFPGIPLQRNRACRPCSAPFFPVPLERRCTLSSLLCGLSLAPLLSSLCMSSLRMSSLLVVLANRARRVPPSFPPLSPESLVSSSSPTTHSLSSRCMSAIYTVYTIKLSTIPIENVEVFLQERGRHLGYMFPRYLLAQPNLPRCSAEIGI